MKKIDILIIVLVLFCQLGYSQDFPSIQTDRPDQTECPFITPSGYLQLENGFSHEKTNSNSGEIQAAAVLVRYGINANFELRLISEYVIDKNNMENNAGFNPVLMGFKTKLLDEKGIIPTTSFIGHITIPKLASAPFQQKYYTPEFRFTMQHTISEKQSLSYNLGAEWNGETTEPTFVYTLTTGYSITQKIGAYVELYGFIPQLEKPDHRFDAGLTYLFNPNHQLDISGGMGLSTKSPDFFLALGYSFRFKI